jgi:hypothetical protein
MEAPWRRILTVIEFEDDNRDSLTGLVSRRARRCASFRVDAMRTTQSTVLRIDSALRCAGTRRPRSHLEQEQKR